MEHPVKALHRVAGAVSASEAHRVPVFAARTHHTRLIRTVAPMLIEPQVACVLLKLAVASRSVLQFATEQLSAILCLQTSGLGQYDLAC